MDTKGDGKVIKELRKNRPLKMDEILSERSKIPAVSGRKKASTTVASEAPGAKATAKISKSEKAKLLDMIKRKTSKSLFAPVDKSIEGSGLTDAVKAAGKFDIWGAADDEEKIEESIVAEDDFVSEIVTQVPAKAPKSFKLKQKVVIPAVKESHPGASYNPTMQDHQGLLRIAHNEELRILADQQKVDAKLAYPKELDSMVSFDDQTGGLLEDSDEESEEEEDDEAAVDGEDKPKKKKGKKSIAERNRLARAAETAKKEAEIKRNKELIKQTNRVNEIMKTVEQEEEDTERKRLETERKKEEKEKAGMKRVGRFK